MENIFNRNFFRAESLEPIVVNNVCLGVAFQILFPDSRGTHLSCIEDFRLFWDDAPVDAHRIRFCLNNKEFLVPALSLLADEYWSLREYAGIKVYMEDLQPGTHKISIEYKYRVPFTGGLGECVRETVRGAYSFTIEPELLASLCFSGQISRR